MILELNFENTDEERHNVPKLINRVSDCASMDDQQPNRESKYEFTIVRNEPPKNPYDSQNRVLPRHVVNLRKPHPVVIFEDNFFITSTDVKEEGFLQKDTLNV